MIEKTFFEFLIFDLEHSGLLLNIPIKHSGTGEAFFDVNYEVDRELLEEFKKDSSRAKDLFKELNENVFDYKGKLHDLLSGWIGNPAIARALASRIKRFCEEYNYDVYSYVASQIRTDIKYRDILNEGNMYSSAIIFESEKRIIAISVTWSV